MENNTVKQTFEDGVRYMENKMLSVCDTDKPIEINGRAYFIQSDKKHLQKLFDDIDKQNV